MHQRLAFALTIAAILWSVVLVASPAAVSRAALAMPAATVYALSSRICHQRPERSFDVAGVQMPVCARCFGLYVSAALGAVLAWGRIRPHGERTRIVLAIAAVPTAVTWSLEAAGVVAFSNVARAVAALPLGLAAGWVIVEMLRYDSSLHGEVNDRGSRVRSC